MHNTRPASGRSILNIRVFPRLALMAGFFGLGVCVAASAGEKMHVVTIDVPGAIDTGCFSDCSVLINNFGAISGTYLDSNDVFHGFVRSPDGKLKTFEAPGADTTAGNFNGTFVNAINDAGAVTGFYDDASGGSHGFLRSPEGAFTTFEVTGSTPGTTTPNALNLEGAIVGFSADQNGVFRPFLRRANGTFVTWSVPGECNATPATGCFGSAAFSINIFGTTSSGFEDDSGNFVDHGLLRSADGRLTTFDVPGAGSGSYQGSGCPGCSRPLNVFGVNAGFFIDGNNVVHGYLRSPTGKYTKFDVPGEGPQGLGCFADCSMGLNDLGAITGSYLDKNNVFHGYIRSPDGKFVTFDAPGADMNPGDFNGTFPVSINDAGMVSGYYIDSNNVFHSFVCLP